MLCKAAMNIKGFSMRRTDALISKVNIYISIIWYINIFGVLFFWSFSLLWTDALVARSGHMSNERLENLLFPKQKASSLHTWLFSSSCCGVSNRYMIHMAVTRWLTTISLGHLSNVYPVRGNRTRETLKDHIDEDEV